MFDRQLAPHLQGLLSRHPAVGLLGPRQVGKTTLARVIADAVPSVYIDLESPRDRARLQDPVPWLESHANELVVLDEIQRLPDLFPVLRGVIDEGRRSGRKTGRFLILGSASVDLLRQSAETLAGRIVYVELPCLNALEIQPDPAHLDALWLRGGFPESVLAGTDSTSMEWRRAFIRTYLERDIPQLGPKVPAETLRRFWTMLAHEQGGLLNASRLASSLAVSGQTVGRYLDLMVDLLLVRRLSPWTSNTGKRLVRSPKVYIRDSGLVHALLELPGLEDLLGHPVAGPSYEGWVLETLAGAAPDGTSFHFYRSAEGAEINVILRLPQNRLWAVEIKRSSQPRPTRGFHYACADLSPERRWIVHPGTDEFSVGQGVTAISVRGLALRLREEAKTGPLGSPSHVPEIHG